MSKKRKKHTKNARLSGEVLELAEMDPDRVMEYAAYGYGRGELSDFDSVRWSDLTPVLSRWSSASSATRRRS